jgi:hypothetical protein
MITYNLMADASDKALERIVFAAKTNVDVLLDAIKRPEVSPAGVSRLCLEVLLESIAGVARQSSNNPELAAAMSALLAAYDEYQKQTIDVHQHLTALARGWACNACKKTAAREAHAGGLKSGNIRVELECRACGAKTPLTKEGKVVLTEVFGALMTPAWNPAANGFIWDQR